MKTPEQYHQEYPIGSQWLLPVTICAHAHPDYPDTWDPRPIQISPTTGKLHHRLWPHTDTLDTLIPAPAQAPAEHPITVTLTLLPTQYAKLCAALCQL